MKDRDALATTTSLCPDCLERVPGRYEERDGGVFLTRECPDHGTTSRRVWGSLDHWEWAADFGPSPEHDGGDLTVDPDHACLAVVEVTDDCNLSCSYCFASSGPGGAHRSTGEIEALLDTVADAGVTAIYLQFDGLTGETYERIRGVDLLEEKHAAVETCRTADLPVVLVPTVVPGVNDHEMGDVVRFALENRDVVRSVNFQPVAHFGRYEGNDGRFAIDDAARLLAEQMETLDPRDVLPAPCCSSYCQIGTAFVPRGTDSTGAGCCGSDATEDRRADATDDCCPDVTDDCCPDETDVEADSFVPLTQYIDDRLWDTLSGMVDEGDYMELLAGTAAGEEWACRTAGCCGVDVPGGVEGLFDEVVPVSFTGFMDADAADVNRLSNCCISVPTTDDDLVPFCGYNMTTEDGEYALRNRNGWGGRPAVDEPYQGSGSADGYRGGGTVADGGRGPEGYGGGCE